MDTSNIVRVVKDFGSYVLTTPVTKEDVGIKLLIDDIELPEAYEIDFSNSDKKGRSITQIGNSTGVEIPVQYIKTGETIYAFYYYVGVGYGKTVRTYRIPNHVRPDRTDEVPEPSQQSVIDQTIAALNNAVESTAADVEQTASDVARAEVARTGAETAEYNAEASATAAAQSEANAATSESNAAESAEIAIEKASEASQAASNANIDADRAEQAAAQNGYMWFYIEDGKLYMDRTPNTKVDFYMQDGKLYVEEVA